MGESYIGNGEQITLSLVVPVFNEEELVEPLIQSCISYFYEKGIRFELLLVDDGSSDGSAECVQRYLSESVRLISMDRNRGKGAAVRKGMLEAKGCYLFYTDADLAYGLERIPEMMALLEKNADLVLGSRTLSKGGYGAYPVMRTMLSKVYSLVITAGSGVGYDTQCGLKGFRSDCAQQIFSQVRTEGYAFDLEVILLAERDDMKICQHPVTILHQGKTKIRFLRSSLTMLRDVRRIRKRLRREKRNCA